MIESQNSSFGRPKIETNQTIQRSQSSQKLNQSKEDLFRMKMFKYLSIFNYTRKVKNLKLKNSAEPFGDRNGADYSERKGRKEVLALWLWCLPFLPFLNYKMRFLRF